MAKKSVGSKIIDIIFFIIVFFVLIKLYGVYKKYNYNEFIKAENIIRTTKFTRDNKEKFENENSYKMESQNFNDAIFYKKIKVKPNTPYKLTCMVKTENVINESGKHNGGAQISIYDTTECSESIIGTNDWQKLEFIFDSKNREEIEIGFRLGGNETKTKGTAWFSDFKLEQGIKDNSNNWNVACFIIKNVDVNIENQNVKLNMGISDIQDMKENMERFKLAAKELSNGKMTVDYDIYEIEEPVKSVTYSEEFAYYLDPSDVKEIIKEYLKKEEYDYIFVAVRLGDNYENVEIPVNDWIGLGGMDLNGIGYSNIRLPNDKSSYIYTYNSYINTFPEEVFIHEFLHSLERILKERNYNIPNLHDYEQYGYKEERLIGLKNWYRDYMTRNIKTKDGDRAGLNEEVYTLTPPAESDFEYSMEIEFSKEPQNIIEEVKKLLENVFSMFEKK